MRHVAPLAALVLLVALVTAGSVQAAPLVFTVTNTADTGGGSLRQAILDANGSVGTNTIVFKIPGSGVHTITPASALPDVTDPVFINGRSQPGYSGTPLIELSGRGLSISAGSSTVAGLSIDGATDGIQLTTNGGNLISGCTLTSNMDGLLVDQGSGNNLIRGNLISGNGRYGINLGGEFGDGGSGNIIQGNKIGTDAAGTAALANGGEGIRVAGNTDHTKIGGKVVNSGAGNLISGNGGAGIFLTGPGVTDTAIQSNLIGTNAAGTAALGNSLGIAQLEATDSLISDDVISGNTGAGISISNSSSSNVVRNNLIGTDQSGASALGNGGEGISITSGADNVFGPGNVISANTADGVLLAGDANNVLRGNRIGTNASGTTVLANGNYAVQVGSPGQPVGGLGGNDGNVIAGGDVVLANLGVEGVPILRNSIFGGGTIVLFGGANNGQVAPTLTSVNTGGGVTTIRGTKTDAAFPVTQFRIEFFVSGACTGTHSPAEQFLFGRRLTTDVAGSRDFVYTVPALPSGQAITATSTDLSSNETSEISNCQLTP